MNNWHTLMRWQQPGLAAWQTAGRLSDLWDGIDRFFETPLAEVAGSPQLLSGWTPAIDLYEDKDNFVVKAELAGMKKENIELSFNDGSLSISGERKAEEKHESAEVYRAERFFGRFQRTINFPVPVNGEQVKAHYQDGILTVTLPKKEEAKPKRIDVNVG